MCVCVYERERERLCACVYTYEKASAYEIEDRGTSGNRESEDILRVKGFRGRGSKLDTRALRLKVSNEGDCISLKILLSSV